MQSPNFEVESTYTWYLMLPRVWVQRQVSAQDRDLGPSTVDVNTLIGSVEFVFRGTTSANRVPAYVKNFAVYACLILDPRDRVVKI